MKIEIRKKAEQFLKELESKVAGATVILDALVMEAVRDGVNVGTVVSIGEGKGGSEWFPVPTGKLLIHIKQRYSTLKTFRERQDDTFNWDGILAAIEETIRCEADRRKREMAVNDVQAQASEALRKRGIRGSSRVLFAGPRVDVPSIKVSFVILPDQLDRVIEMLAELEVEV